MKKQLVLALIAALACTGAAAVNAADQPAWEYEEADVTLLIDGDVASAGYEAVCELAEEKLGITVDIEIRPGGADGDNIVKTRLASGDMADLCAYNSGALLSALNPTEYFADLSDNEWIQSRLDETYASTVTVGGMEFGVPLSASNTGAVMYNKDLYEQYGLEVPQTWDEFMANCETLKEAGEVAVIGSFGDSWTAQVPFLGDNANIMASAPDFAEKLMAGETTYSDTPAALASFQKCYDLNQYMNEDYLATTYDDACDKLYNGEGAHWICLTQALSNIYQLNGENDNIGVFAVPATEGDTYLTTWMPTSIYLNKDAENYDAALKFLEFYVSDEALDCYTEAILPDGPYCIKGYKLPENAYPAVAEDMQKYFDEGKTGLALEFMCDIKGSNCPQICQEVGSALCTAEEAAAKYDADCLLQAQQLGYEWAQ